MVVLIEIIGYNFRYMNKFTFMASKFRHNKMLFLVLLVSFLSLQWSSAHIHLSGQHDHDDSHHQHEIEAHAHHDSLSSHGAHSIDDTDKLVELDLDCNRYHTSKYDSQCIIFSSVNNQLSIYYQVSNNEPPITYTSKLRYIDYSTIRFRGPPQVLL